MDAGARNARFPHPGDNVISGQWTESLQRVACSFIPCDEFMVCSQTWLSMREMEITGHSPREQLDIRRRRLQFRCWHRGTQEIDLVLGSFAEKFLERLDSAELERFEALLDCPDVDLFDWIFVGIAPPPQHDHDLMRRLRGFSVERRH